MDISFKSKEGRFNYRVCAIMIDSGRILAMHDEQLPYYYLPGGRVKIGETAEHAVIREVREELDIIPHVVRPLWLNQAYFIEDVSQDKFHELCIYFLMDISNTDILIRGNRFTVQEQHHINTFEWLTFEQLNTEYFYPLFIKREIFNLPDKFTILTEQRVEKYIC